MINTVKCWKCGVQQQDLTDPKKIPFRAICEKCGACLHCCVNCQHYKPGLPNDCAIPGTEYISDREATNFCEEFTLKQQTSPPKVSPENIEKRLFGKGPESPPKKGFDSLFRD